MTIEPSVSHDLQAQDIKRMSATVKWYSAERGYGFLLPDDEGDDIFMHFSALDAAGCRRVEAGDSLICDIGEGVQGRQVLRILEVKFGEREPRVAPVYVPRSLSSEEMETLYEVDGTLKWFNPIKGYGFIFPDDGKRDIFFHASVLRDAGYESIEPGVRVRLKVVLSEKGREARHLEVLD